MWLAPACWKALRIASLADALHFLADKPVQRARRALDDYVEARPGMAFHLVCRIHQRLRQIAAPAGGPQLANPVAPLDQHGVGPVEGIVDQRPDRLVRRDAVGNRLEAQDQALKALEQRVVKLARDPFTFGEPHLEPGLQPRGDAAHMHRIS